MRVFASEDASTRGSADRVGAEGVYKQRALRGEAVDIRCLEMFGVAAFAIGGDGLQRVIIGKDKQDVRLLGLSKADGRCDETCGKKEYGEFAHRNRILAICFEDRIFCCETRFRIGNKDLIQRGLENGLVRFHHSFDGFPDVRKTDFPRAEGIDRDFVGGIENGG